jgi:hypothetical protein
VPNRVELDEHWRENVGGATVEFLDRRLGPDIADDARRYCPERTGALRDSIEHHLEGTTLIVSATGSDERTYAAYVELGHRVYHPSTGHAGPETVPPQSFLRPALMVQRGE